MTLQELKGYPYIIQLIDRYQKELTELSADYERNKTKIIELREKISNFQDRLHKLNVFFDSIEDLQTLQIFELKFKHGYTWAQVAAYIGGYNTMDTVRMRCYRYLKKQQKKSSAAEAAPPNKI